MLFWLQELTLESFLSVYGRFSGIYINLVRGKNIIETHWLGNGGALAWLW